MFFLSWRQLMARKKQTFLILLGISFGTLLFVSISGVQLGMRSYMLEQLLNNSSHVLIQGEQKNIDQQKVQQTFYGQTALIKWVTPPTGLREESKLENLAGWVWRFNRDPRVLDYSPRLKLQAVVSNGKFNTAVALTGVIPERQLQVSPVNKYMQEGKFNDLKGGNNIVIGTKVARDLGVHLGQYLKVNTSDSSKAFKIVGLIHYGNEQLDSSLAFVNLTDLQALSKAQGRLSEIAVALYDIEQASEVADEWKIFSKDKVQSWKEANQAFMEIIKVQDFTRYFITSTILIVASFGIYNVLSIMINQKKKEIAILRAIGDGPKKILHLVLYQGLLLGVGGGMLGLILGFFLSRLIGSIDFSIQIGGSNHLIVSYDYSIYGMGLIAALISSTVASYIPAYSASRMTPIDIIRSES